MTSPIKKLRLTALVPVLSVPLLIAMACGSEAPSAPAPSGTGGTTTGTGGSLPGQGGIAQGGSAAAQGGAGPGQGGFAPAQGGAGPGQGGSAPGQGGSGPSQGGSTAGGSTSGGATNQGGAIQNGGSSAGGSQNAGASGAISNGGSAMGGSSAGGAPAMGGSGGGTTGDMKDFAKELDGFVIGLPCQATTSVEVCQTNKAGQGCPENTDVFLDGVTATKATVKMGGNPGTIYTVTLRFQGIVEHRIYSGGMDASAMQSNGFYVGGIPPRQGDYNIYGIRASSPKQDYFLNSIGGPELQRHQAFVVDFVGTIKVEGGSTLTLISQDSNCSAIKNCVDPPDTACVAGSVPNLDPKISAQIGGNGSSYNGQFVGMVVQSVTL